MSNLKCQNLNTWDVDEELKVLAIGNSFSDDALWLLPEILKSLGIKKFRVSNLYVPGCLLETHLSNIQNNNAVYEFRTNTGCGWNTVFETTLIDGVNSDDWNFITFQQGSPKSGLSESYSYLLEIISFIRNLKPNAKFGWHMTWAYQQDFKSVAFEHNYYSKQIIMYNLICESVKNIILVNDDIEFIVPNGTAIQNARTSFLGDSLTRDGFHMSYDIGRYITALSYAYLLTRCDLDDVLYKPDTINEGVKTICIESVKNAVSKPFEVICSLYRNV